MVERLVPNVGVESLNPSREFLGKKFQDTGFQFSCTLNPWGYFLFKFILESSGRHQTDSPLLTRRSQKL